MVTRRRTLPHAFHPVRLGFASALVGAAFACNALLDNEPRALAPSHSSGGVSSGGSSGSAGTDGREAGATSALGGGAGESAGAGAGAAQNGASGRDSGGQGTAGEGATNQGGEAGKPGEAGAGGGVPDPCELATAECSKGEVTDAGSVACGHCGSQAMSRLCGDTCTWSDPMPSGACTGEGCAPNDTGTRTVNCPCGGTKQQTQTCGAACAWGAWTDTTACDLTCCTTVVFCNTRENAAAAAMYPGRGTWCQRETAACSNAEVDADCLTSANSTCGGVVQTLFTAYN